MACGNKRGWLSAWGGIHGLAHRKIRLISGGSLNSPWGLVIAPQSFADLRAPGHHPVLLVGNAGNGLINGFDTTNGSRLGQLKDPDGEPIQIPKLRAVWRAGRG